MKRTEYLCEICQDLVCTTNGQVKRPFIGFQFDRQNPPFSFEVKDKHNATRHICCYCLDAFVELNNLVKTVGMEQ